jgi:hypothetical protein
MPEVLIRWISNQRVAGPGSSIVQNIPFCASPVNPTVRALALKSAGTERGQQEAIRLPMVRYLGWSRRVVDYRYVLCAAMVC